MDNNYKITKKSAADLVCEKMKELIINKTWTAGEKIPTEMELSHNFGVNRLTVRIALQRLNTLGLLDIRVGDGTYIKKFDLSSQISELAEFYISKETLNNVGEYRKVLEIGCLEAIIERYTEEELEHFRQLCEQFEQELEQYYSETDPQQSEIHFRKTIDTSEALHTTLVSMAHNDLMTYALALAREPMRRHMQFNASKRLDDLDSDQRNVWCKRWMQLYEALRLKDKTKCHETLSQIIDI